MPRSKNFSLERLLRRVIRGGVQVGSGGKTKTLILSKSKSSMVGRTGVYMLCCYLLFANPFKDLRLSLLAKIIYLH